MNLSELKSKFAVEPSQGGYEKAEEEAEKDAELLMNNKPLPRLGGVNTTISYGVKFVTPIEATLEKIALAHDSIVQKYDGGDK